MSDSDYEESRCLADKDGWCRVHPICELGAPKLDALKAELANIKNVAGGLADLNTQQAETIEDAKALKTQNVALREVLAKCRQRFRDYEMDAETLPPRHHFEAMVEIDDFLKPPAPAACESYDVELRDPNSDGVLVDRGEYPQRLVSKRGNRQQSPAPAACSMAKCINCERLAVLDKGLEMCGACAAEHKEAQRGE